MVTQQIRKIPNDTANEVLYAALEVSPGVLPAEPNWFRINGQPDITSTPTILDEQDVTGTYVRKANPAKGMTGHAGTWGGTLSFERLPSINRLVLESGGAPTISAAPAYTYAQQSALLYDDVDTYTLIYGVAGDLWRATGVRLGQYNIEGSVGDANSMWRFGSTLQMTDNDQLPQEEVTATGGTSTTLVKTGAGWTVDAFEGAYIFPDRDTNLAGARLISGNTLDTITVTTPFAVAPAAGTLFLISGLPPDGVAPLVEEKIRFPGTRLFLDPYGVDGSDIGITQILKRFIGFNVSWNLNLDPKMFGEDVDSNSGIYGRGELIGSGQVRLEADRPDEFRQLKRLDQLSLRIEQEGSELAPGVRKLARINCLRIVWTARTRDARNNNRTQTMAFWIYEDVPYTEVVTRMGLPVLP